MSRRQIRCYARDTDQGDGCSEVANCAVDVDSAEKYQRRHGRETVSDNNGMLVIDIRTPREFTWGHIDAAENIDYDSSDFRWTLCAVDKDSTSSLRLGGCISKALAVFAELGSSAFTTCRRE